MVQIFIDEVKLETRRRGFYCFFFGTLDLTLMVNTKLLSLCLLTTFDGRLPSSCSVLDSKGVWIDFHVGWSSLSPFRSVSFGYIEGVAVVRQTLTMYEELEEGVVEC